jgi:hypothetical protein
MSFTNLRSLSAVKTDRGSELAALAEVTNLNLSCYAYGTPFSAPLLINSTRSGSTEQATVNLEGDAVVKLDGSTERTYSMTFGQQDSKTKKFLEFDSNGKTFAMVKQEHVKTIDNEWQWVVVPMMKPDPSFSMPATGFEVEKTFNIENNSSALTIDLTQFNTAGGWGTAITCAAFEVPANQGYAIYVQAV